MKRKGSSRHRATGWGLKRRDAGRSYAATGYIYAPAERLFHDLIVTVSRQFLRTPRVSQPQFQNNPLTQRGFVNKDKDVAYRTAQMRIDYLYIAKTIAALTEGEDDSISLMATIACELHHADDRFDWTGFYRVTAPEMLKIGPYQGGHGCLHIPFGKGVCGAAARTGLPQLVADVDAFPGHIACASSTRSELVLPVWDKHGTLIAVLDIDSNQPDAFTQDDVAALTKILRTSFSL
jgi:GAF domain-containing protein